MEPDAIESAKNASQPVRAGERLTRVKKAQPAARRRPETLVDERAMSTMVSDLSSPAARQLAAYAANYGRPCDSKEKAYLAIIITVLPLWVILTTLIIFVLLAFHRNFRATKIYDNCNKQTAQFTYYLELRTGDTSSTYNRRRTTLSIDLFDDSQTTLARVAIPGHVIFGRKESPVSVIEDDKFFDLRATRLWLYRASRLKNVATIRLTHSGQEPDARIMVYGVEIRSSDRDQHKLFFPVMNYITAYGCYNKPNTCFDLELSGSIDDMGGSSSEMSPISASLSLVDYSFLVYLFISVSLFVSAHPVLEDSWLQPAQASYKGLLVGLACFLVTLAAGLLLRYVIKRQFSLAIGLGFCGYLYHSTLFAVLLGATVLWIYSTVIAYKDICPSYYSMWLLSLCVAIIEAVFLAILGSIVHWALQVAMHQRHTDQFIVNEDVPSLDKSGASRNKSLSVKQNFVQQQQQAHHPAHLARQQQQQQHQHQLAPPMVAAEANQQAPHWPPGGIPVQYYMSHAGYPPPNAYPPMVYSPLVGGPQQAYQPPYPGYYQQQISPPLVAQQTGPPPAPPLPPPPAQHMSPPGSQPLRPKKSDPQQEPTYQQQLKTVKSAKKVGSNESTGSTYYQQIMKNKGGVKSISQYGELLRQKKANPQKKQ